MDPIDFALKHVAETKALLEKLVRSSEGFDYPEAKRALEMLQDKTRDLGRFKAELEMLRARPADNVRAVDFNRAN